MFVSVIEVLITWEVVFNVEVSLMLFIVGSYIFIALVMVRGVSVIFFFNCGDDAFVVKALMVTDRGDMDCTLILSSLEPCYPSSLHFQFKFS